jgi:hypothetical protein
VAADAELLSAEAVLVVNSAYMPPVAIRPMVSKATVAKGERRLVLP